MSVVIIVKTKNKNFKKLRCKYLGRAEGGEEDFLSTTLRRRGSLFQVMTQAKNTRVIYK